MATEAAASYIDTLLKRVASRGGNLGVRFEGGTPVRITDGNVGTRDVTNRVLTPQEIMAAVTPIIPDATKKQMQQQPLVTFEYDCAGVGVFTIAIRRTPDEMMVSIDPPSAKPQPVAAAPPPPPPPPPPSAPAPQPEFVIETTSVNAAIEVDEPSMAVVEDSAVEVVVTTEDVADVISAPVEPIAAVAAAHVAPAPAAPPHRYRSVLLPSTAFSI